MSSFMPVAPVLPVLLSRPEAAEVLGVTPERLEFWAYKRFGPAYVRVGKDVRYPLDALNEFLKVNTVRFDKAA